MTRPQAFIRIMVGWENPTAWFASIRLIPREDLNDFECYDTPACPSQVKALAMARAFCRWKGWRVRKIRREP